MNTYLSLLTSPSVSLNSPHQPHHLCSFTFYPEPSHILHHNSISWPSLISLTLFPHFLLFNRVISLSYRLVYCHDTSSKPLSPGSLFSREYHSRRPLRPHQGKNIPFSYHFSITAPSANRYPSSPGHHMYPPRAFSEPRSHHYLFVHSGEALPTPLPLILYSSSLSLAYSHLHFPTALPHLKLPTSYSLLPTCQPSHFSDRVPPNARISSCHPSLLLRIPVPTLKIDEPSWPTGRSQKIRWRRASPMKGSRSKFPSS